MSTSPLVLIQQAMTRYVLPTTLGLGNLGNLILLAIFLQKHHQKNPCSHYLLAAAVFSIVGSNWAVVPLIYSAVYPDPLSNSLALCRARGYIIHSCAMSFRTLIVLAAADRYALTSAQPSIRSFSSLKMARRGIIVVPLFWFAASVHVIIGVSIENGRCFVYGLYRQIYSIYQLIRFGILPTALMILFSVLIIKNIRRSRNRIVTITTIQRTNAMPGQLRSRDKQLLKLVTADIVISFICTFPYTINTIYAVLISNIPNKPTERLQIESFSVFLTMWFPLYLKYSTTFYAYLTTYKAFRSEFKTVLLKGFTIIMKMANEKHRIRTHSRMIT